MKTRGGRLGDVKQNIFLSADYYPPGTYRRLLSWYHDLNAQSDPLGAEFIPLSATKPNPKWFVVGVLPPATNITGRLLDRSSSIAALDPGELKGLPSGPAGAGGSGGYTGGKSNGEIIKEIAESMNGIDQRKDPEKYTDFLLTPGDKAEPGTEAWMTGYYLMPDTYSCALFGGGCLRAAGISPEDYPELYEQYDAVNGAAYENLRAPAERLGAVVQLEDTLTNLPDLGDIVYTQSATGAHVFVVTTPLSEHEKYKVPFHESISGGQQPYGVWSYQSGNSAYDGPAYPGDGIDPDSGGIGFSHGAGKGEYYWMDPGYKSGAKTRTVRYAGGEVQVLWWVDVSKLNLPGGTGEPPPETWKDEGADAAAEAAKENDKTAGTGLNETPLGKKLLAAQARQIREAQEAYAKMANTPPLRLLVNPRSFDVKGAKIVNDGNWTRKGHVIEHWGDEQDKISASGRIAGFYAVDALDTDRGPGLTRTARNFSRAWQNFQSLYMLYRNNGAMFLSDYNQHGEAGEHPENLALVGTIYIYYDGILYLGSFDTFNISEEEGSPHTIEYSWEFTVRAAFLLDRLPGEDRSQDTYGAPALIRGIKTDVLGKGYQIETNQAALADPPLEGIEYIQALERGEIPIDDQDENRVPVPSPILDSLVEQAGANPGNTGGAEDEEPFAQPRFLPENI